MVNYQWVARKIKYVDYIKAHILCPYVIDFLLTRNYYLPIVTHIGQLGQYSH